MDQRHLVLLLLPALLAAAQSTDIECFQKVAVGRRLNGSDVASTHNLGTVKLCEQECERRSCPAYSFGVGSEGNGTCELASTLPKAPTVVDTDYDLFVKNVKCLNKTSCFRRLVSGRFLDERHIRKTLYCDSLRSCEEACAQETQFDCRGFNFRFDAAGYEGSRCQLTSSPANILNLSTDYHSDRDVDFYERDSNAPRSCFYPHNMYRPWNQYGHPDPWPEYPPPHPDGNHLDPDGGFDRPWGRPEPPGRRPGWGAEPGWDRPWGRPAPGRQDPPLRPPPSRPDYPPSRPDYPPSRPDYPPSRPDYPPSRPDYPPSRPEYPSSRPGYPPPSRPELPPPRPEYPPSRPEYPPSRHDYPPSRPDHPPSRPDYPLARPEYPSSRPQLPPPRDYPPLRPQPHDHHHPQPGAVDRRPCCPAAPAQHDKWDRGDSKYNHGGGAYGLGSGGGMQDECFIRSRMGFRLSRPLVVVALKVQNLYECELECANEKKFDCQVFDFRYATTAPSGIGDNCHLGERPTKTLDAYTDILPDRDYDVYDRNPQAPPRGCQPKKHYGSECFERVRSGFKLKGSMAKYSLNTPTVSDCEAACIKMTIFTCRAFSYRFGPPVIGESEDNCILTDWPVSNMDPGKHMVLEPGCELYHRGSYGHGCEINKYPNRELDRPRLPHKPHDGYDKGWKQQDKGYLPPSGGGYLPPSGGGYPKPGFHDNRGYLPPSYPQHSPPYHTSTTDQLCYIRHSTPARLLPSAIKTSLLVASEQDCKSECSRARDKTHFRCATFSYSTQRCELSDIEMRDLRLGYDYDDDNEFWMMTWDFGASTCYHPDDHHGLNRPQYPPPQQTFQEGGRDGVEGTWARFTVSGQPCRAGTFCTQNPEIGVWTCPTDNGEWDYCCRSGHQCGYSQGFQYPWCYVGSADQEQWRPCSEKYFPYPHSGRGQYWPVAYLHTEFPPNATNDTTRPSIVDSFLDDLRRLYSTTPSAASQSTVSLSPAIDTTQLPAEPRMTDDVHKTTPSAMSKMWSWGQSKYNTSHNATTILDAPTTESTTIAETTTLI